MALGTGRRAASVSRASTTLSPVNDTLVSINTLSRPLIKNGQHPKGAPGDELVVDEVHAPRLIATTRWRHDAAVQTEPLLAPRAHTHLQALDTIQAVNQRTAGDLDAWRDDYNLVRPHSSLQDPTPAAVGALWLGSRFLQFNTAVI